MFGGCENAPPKLRDLTMFSKQATGSKNQATAKLQEAGSLQKARAEKEEKKTVTFLADFQCFLEVVKFSIQTQSSAQLPHQMPDKTLSSSGTHPTTLEDKTPLPNITATKENFFLTLRHTCSITEACHLVKEKTNHLYRFSIRSLGCTCGHVSLDIGKKRLDILSFVINALTLRLSHPNPASFFPHSALRVRTDSD